MVERFARFGVNAPGSCAALPEPADMRRAIVPASRAKGEHSLRSAGPRKAFGERGRAGEASLDRGAGQAAGIPVRDEVIEARLGEVPSE